MVDEQLERQMGPDSLAAWEEEAYHNRMVRSHAAVEEAYPRASEALHWVGRVVAAAAESAEVGSAVVAATVAALAIQVVLRS